jgi:hypothetical protein
MVSFTGSQVSLARSLADRISSAGRGEISSRELAAGLELLRRLQARRFFRPVFRVLPSLQEGKLKVTPSTVADKLRKPELRYRIEREIEIEANLRLGSIVIHCPRESTAEKIANALLVMPDADAEKAKICRLTDITQLSLELFSTHERAIKAVESMYKSMWRLVVYVSPDYLPHYEEIVAKAGQVLFKAVGSKDAQKMYPGAALSNDPMLQLELEKRRDAASALAEAHEHVEAPARALSQGAEATSVTLSELLVAAGFAPKSGGEFDRTSLEEFVKRAASKFREDEVIEAVYKGMASPEERRATIDWMSAHPMPHERYTRFKELVNYQATWQRKGSAAERIKRAIVFLDQAYEKSADLFQQ